MKNLIASLLLVLSAPILFSETSIKESLRSLDADWEKAVLETNIDVFDKILHPDFVWVHNHAGTIQVGKEVFLERAKNKINTARIKYSDLVLLEGEKLGQMPGAARTQHDVQILVQDETAVLYGYTFKDYSDFRIKTSNEPESRVYYNFMRTYVLTEGTWLLLSNHTMQIPSDEMQEILEQM